MEFQRSLMEVLEINLVTKGIKEMGMNPIPSYIGVSSTIQWIINFMTTHIKRLPMQCSGKKQQMLF